MYAPDHSSTNPPTPHMYHPPTSIHHSHTHTHTPTLSLSLSLTHTHTHTHTHTTPTHTHTHTLSLSLSHSHTHTHTHSLTHTNTLTHTHTLYLHYYILLVCFSCHFQNEVKLCKKRKYMSSFRAAFTLIPCAVCLLSQKREICFPSTAESL
jgi:hypothetical protein